MKNRVKQAKVGFKKNNHPFSTKSCKFGPHMYLLILHKCSKKCTEPKIGDKAIYAWRCTLWCYYPKVIDIASLFTLRDVDVQGVKYVKYNSIKAIQGMLLIVALLHFKYMEISINDVELMQSSRLGIPKTPC